MSNFYTEPFVSAGEMEFPSQPYITAQPQNHTATGPEEYVLTVIAAGAVSYQWEVFDGESWSTIPGATSDTLTITINPSMNGWRYRVIVTGADGSTVTSKAAQIAVKGVYEYTLEGAIVTFNGPARITSLTADINAVQSGSGDPSPTNIRPISGWDAVNVVRTGKNLFPPIVEGTFRDITATVNDDGSVTLSGTANGSATFRPSATFVLKAGRYVLSGNTDYPNTAIYLNGISGSTDTGNGSTITLTEDTVIDPVVQVYSGKTVNTTLYPLLRLASEDSTFESYQGTTYPITLPQTIYGGVLDVTSGVLTVDKGYKLISGADIAGYGTASSGIPYVSINVSPQPVSGSDVLSNTYIPSTTPTVDKAIRIAGATIYIYDSRFTSQEVAESLLNANPVQAVYELATPTTVTLTPTQITALTGVNNIWADSGNVTLVYVA